MYSRFVQVVKITISLGEIDVICVKSQKGISIRKINTIPKIMIIIIIKIRINKKINKMHKWNLTMTKINYKKMSRQINPLNMIEINIKI